MRGRKGLTSKKVCNCVFIRKRFPEMQNGDDNGVIRTHAFNEQWISNPSP